MQLKEFGEAAARAAKAAKNAARLSTAAAAAFQNEAMAFEDIESFVKAKQEDGAGQMMRTIKN